MKKIRYIWSIVKDRWMKPYDDIILRFLLNMKVTLSIMLDAREELDGKEQKR